MVTGSVKYVLKALAAFAVPIGENFVMETVSAKSSRRLRIRRSSLSMNHRTPSANSTTPNVNRAMRLFRFIGKGFVSMALWFNQLGADTASDRVLCKSLRASSLS